MSRFAQTAPALAVILILSSIQTSRAADPKESPDINIALRGRDYTRAVSLIDEALKSTEGEARGFLLLRKGLALQYADKYDDAIKTFEKLTSDFPDGTWAHKARMHIADIRMAQKKFAAAEKIYAQRVKQLVGDARKSEIAKVYLDFAEEYFKPDDKLTKPNYERAKTFYEKALELEPAGALRETVLYQRALCNQKLGQVALAAEQYEAYLLEFDPQYREMKKMRTGGAPLPEKAVEGGAYWIDARLGLGECKRLMQDFQESRRVLGDLVASLERNGRKQSTTSSMDRELNKAWIKAKSIIARTYQFPAPPDNPNLTSGVKVLDELIDRHPESKEAIQAQFDIGLAYMNRQRTDAAIEAFRALIDRKHIRPTTDDDLKLTETLSQEALFYVGRLLLVQKKYAEAIGTWNQYVAKYPSGPQWAAAQTSIIDAEYAIGDDAKTDERYDDARQAWNTFLEKYPLDPRAGGILLAFGDMAYAEQAKREKDGAQPDWNQAITAWKRLVEKAPATETAGLAQFRIAQTLEEKVGDLDAAIEAYKKLDWSQYASLARQRMDEMRGVRLTVATERVFRSNEKPKIRVDVRNIDTLTIKLYPIDMEDYFRKSRTIVGVENLDLLLIDPEKTFEIAIKDFAAYKPITQEIELPIDNPSAYAVYVSNEKSTAEEKFKTNAAKPTRLQATTLVVKSDIDIIVKSSRGQLLIYAQDMLKMTPATGVRLLAADQKSVILEGETGDDGFWISTDKKIKSAEGLSIFALREGHISGTGLSLMGLSFASGLQPRGYIYTDRPAYRPGDSVNIRGILREVADGAYVLPTQPEDKRLRWKIDVIDAKGRTLRSDEITLTDFGTFSSLFRVSEDAPVGNYKIIARRVDGPAFEGAFAVETFQLAKAYLTIEFDNRVVMRGKKVTGNILAKYHYGEPVIGKDIEYEIHFPNGDIHKLTGKTDDAGKVPFEIDTMLLPEEGAVTLTARQAELNMATADAFYVAVRDFTAALSPLRPLYLSEEPVEVKLETNNLKGEPISHEMTVTAFLRTYDKNTWAESKVESAKITTDANTGVGRASMKLVKGGQYRLRAEGQDANGQTVTAEATVSVSDDKDATRLRLFTERQHYKVGETITVDLHSRIETDAESNSDKAKSKAQTPLLAVILCEGEGIFHHHTTPIQPGHNTIELPVSHEHFPNFKLSVAVMAGNHFHQAFRDFTIERELTIVVKPNKIEFKPREEMQVELTVTDQQGKPVQGEVGIAMIDGAILAQYPDNTPKIVPFFQSTARRSTQSRTETSCRFAYRPTTVNMVTDVLDLAKLINIRGSTISENEDLAVWMDARSTPAPVTANGSQWQITAKALKVPARGFVGQSLGEEADGHPSYGYQLQHDANRRELGDIPAEPELSMGWSAGERFVDIDGDGHYDNALVPGNDDLSAQASRLASLGYFNSPRSAELNPATQTVNLRYRSPRGGGPDHFGLGGGRFAGGSDKSELGDEFATLTSTEEQSLGREALNRRIQNRVFEYCQSAIRNGSLTNAALDRRICDMVQAVPPRMYYPEVAYWNPHVVTDANGKASVTITLPDTSTSWTLIARGATKETIVGDGRAEVLSKNDFLVEWATPPNLIEGDTFTPTAQVHCLVPFTGEITVHYEATRPNGERVASGDRKIESKSGGVFDIEFDPIEVPACEKITLKLTAQTGECQANAADAKPNAKPAPSNPKVAAAADAKPQAPLSDALTLNIPIRPWGLRVESHIAGVVKDSDFVEIELPQPGNGDAYHNLELTVAVGSSIQRWLIEEALETGDRWECIDEGYRNWRATPPRTHADTAAVLLAALYASDYIASNAAAQDIHASADAALLDERIAGLTGQLLAAQNEDGGWPWCGKAGDSDPWTSAAVAWSLGKAIYNGRATSTDAVSKLKSYLQKTFADAPIQQTELKAVVLHGLAWIGDIDFSHANRLYRNREELSTSGLAHLALIFTKLDRKSLANEILQLIATKSRETTRGTSKLCEVPTTGNSAWMQSELEVTAMALLAQLQTDPNADRVAPMVAYLVSTARTDGWRPHKAKGPVIAALATYYARGEKERANFKLLLTVNGAEAGIVASDASGSLVLRFTGDQLKPGKQRIDLGFTGRGKCAYAVTLSGFKSHFPSSKETRNDYVWVNNRTIQPPQLEYRGQQVRRGFQTASRYDSFSNTAKSVPVGTVVSVHTDYYRIRSNRLEAPDRDYFIVQESIPAGFRLLTDTLSGQYLSYDYADNQLTLYYGNKDYLGDLSYQMVAATPGEYRLPPTFARSLYRPDIYHLNKADQKLAVLPRGQASPDDYRLTPDELFDLGRFNFDDGDFVAAAGFLKQLIGGEWSLEDTIYRDSIRMLLTCALRQNDNDAIVNNFEILKEKYTDLVIPFHEIVRVAEAYAATGQPERACVIYRATADSSFVRETAVGGTLQQEGRFLDGIDFLVRLWREYPDTPQVETVFFATSQVLYAKADMATSLKTRRDGRGKSVPVTRTSMLAETIQMLEAFVTLYPESPAADEASYSLVNAYLELDDFDTVVKRTAELLKIFPKSRWLDRFRYMQALALFSLGEFDKALAIAIQVADSTFVDDQGVVRPSPNRWLALYIAGQIYHAQSKIDKAIEYYSKVKTQFSDASEAVEHFEHKFVRLPEVTIFHPDGGGYRESEEWARYMRTRGGATTGGSMAVDDPSVSRKYESPFIQIDYRNLKSAVLQVYRVDLMKLALLEKNLNQITAVNLAGIKPILEKTVALDEASVFVDKSLRVPIHVTTTAHDGDTEAESKADGAYLVICRGGDLFASGLVLVTPLAVEVQEEVGGDRTRVNVVNALTRSGVKNVHVKVIGTGMSSFVSGDSDLRGMFLAENVSGAPTAIARDANGHFAFYRSESIEAARLADRIADGSQKDKESQPRQKADYRGNLMFDNKAIQSENCATLQGVFDQKQRGVEVKKAQ